MSTDQPLVQMRCARCNKRLGDYVNAIADGYAIFVRICRHCGHRNEIRMTADTATR
jgi:phage FluMu protein Com